MKRLVSYLILALAASIVLARSAGAEGFERVTVIQLQPGLSTWITFGTLNGGTGGLASGAIGPFQHPCGQTSRDGHFFIADSGSETLPPAVYVYKRDQAHVNLVFVKKIDLAGTGKPGAICKLAATRGYLYIAVGRARKARVINLATLTRAGATLDQGTPIDSITANSDYAVISQGPFWALYTDQNQIFVSGGQSVPTIVPDND